MRLKLFTPGPVEVRDDVLQAQARPMINHRHKAYEELHKGVVEKLRKALEVKGGRLFLFTSSSTGAMEAAMRNLVLKRVLVATCGAFSERWFSIATTNGKDAVRLAAEWGRGNHAEDIEKKLREGGFDTLATVHSETSTGVLNRLNEIAEVKKKFPDLIWTVDAVSSMAGVKIEMEKWGIDFIFAGVQKAWGLPAGLTVVYASDAAIERAAKVPNKGYYFDIVKYAESDRKFQTPETPCVSLIQSLDFQLDRMLAEGMEQRLNRTMEMAKYCRSWALERGFKLFPEAGYEGVTLSCIENTKGVDTGKMAAELEKRGFLISEGYGKLKGRTFRVAHMADITMEDLKALLSNIDDVLR